VLERNAVRVDTSTSEARSSEGRRMPMLRPVALLLLAAGGAAASMALLRPMAQRPPEPSSTPPALSPAPVAKPAPDRPGNSPRPADLPGSRPARSVHSVSPATPTAGGDQQPTGRGWGHGSSSAPPTPANLPTPRPASPDDVKDRSSRPRSSPSLTAQAASTPTADPSEQEQPSVSAGQAHESDGWIELEGETAPFSSASRGDLPAQAPSSP
jgi:hypothetical protein